MAQAIALLSAGGSSSLGGPAPSGDSGRPQLERAVLKLYDHASGKGTASVKPGRERSVIAFQFNPKEVTITKASKWDRKPSKEAPKAATPDFLGGEPCKLSVEMFFDASAEPEHGVALIVDSLFGCCVPTKDSIDKKTPLPPLVVLHWGKVSTFPAYVSSVSAKYTRFAPDGTPLRAVCTVAMEEVPDEPWRQNPTSGGRSVRRAHRMLEGDTLASVARAEYGDASLWRGIAEYNGVDDPLRVALGTTLLLPLVAELAGG